MTRLFFFTIVILFGELSLFAQELIPNDSLTLVKLRVEKPNKFPIEGQYLRIIDLETNTKFEVVTDEKGAINFLIPAKKVYKIIIETFYGKLMEVEMDLPDETNLTYEFDLTIGVSNELDISYKTNSYELDSSAYPNINQLFHQVFHNQGGYPDQTGYPLILLKALW